MQALHHAVLHYRRDMHRASFRAFPQRSTIFVFAARDAIRSARHLLDGMRFP
jgi:hypothetical protein